VITPAAFLVASFLISRASSSAIARRAVVGLLAGLVATLAYDAFRLASNLVGFVSQPFRSIELYGLVIVGSRDLGTARVVGWLFHLWNGASFGMFFAVAFRPAILMGIAWGLFLELALVITSPKLLALTLRDEVLATSLLGHVAYGAVLATVARRAVKPNADAKSFRGRA